MLVIRPYSLPEGGILYFTILPIRTDP
jgi:hypothetical protein